MDRHILDGRNAATFAVCPYQMFFVKIDRIQKHTQEFELSDSDTICPIGYYTYAYLVDAYWTSSYVIVEHDLDDAL